MSSLCPGKPWQTKLSSAGLIYLHFGHKLLAQLLGTSEEDSTVGTLYDKVGTEDRDTPQIHLYQANWEWCSHSTVRGFGAGHLAIGDQPSPFQSGSSHTDG
jgi:hypothetical protein